MYLISIFTLVCCFRSHTVGDAAPEKGGSRAFTVEYSMLRRVVKNYDVCALQKRIKSKSFFLIFLKIMNVYAARVKVRRYGCDVLRLIGTVSRIFRRENSG